MTDDWRGLFRPHILERGIRYFEMGAVTDAAATSRGFRAVVKGSYHAGI